MECDEAHARLDAYFDGELSEPERARPPRPHRGVR